MVKGIMPDQSDEKLLIKEIDQPGCSIRVANRAFDEIFISLAGEIRIENIDVVRQGLSEAVKSEPLKNIIIDLGHIRYIDSSGAATLVEIKSICSELHNSFKLQNIPHQVKPILEMLDLKIEAKGILEPRTDPNFLEQIGQGVDTLKSNLIHMLTFIGSVVVAVAEDASRPKKARWDSLSKLIEKGGTDALPIASVLSFLMGAVLAFQAAIQLRKFGANVFVADLVSLSICLEMGPLMTAIIVSGRSGAAYAAHIGTMQVNEEIDALRVMGIDPIRYLVGPRILAIALVMPCLTLFADFLGILGGCFVSVLSLDLTPTVFFAQVHRVLEISDVLKGLLKSFAFGIEIALIGCMRGFQVRGGAENVGHATTSAVVTCIFILTVTDAVFSVVYHYTGF